MSTFCGIFRSECSSLMLIIHQPHYSQLTKCCQERDADYTRVDRFLKNLHPQSPPADYTLSADYTWGITNITLHYVTKGDTNKPLMLFLHGFPEFWYSWRHQLQEFSDSYRCVAVDMRGYSESEKPRDVSSYYINPLADDIKDLIQYLGYEKCILVAHDWGGAVAYAVADFYPEVIDQLIVCNAPYGRAFMQKMDSWEQRKKSWYMFWFLLPCLPEIFLRKEDMKFVDEYFRTSAAAAKPGAFTDDDLEAYKYTFQHFHDLLGPLNYYRSSLRYKPDRRAKDQVDIRTLVIWGTGDVALAKDLPELSKKYFTDLTIHYIEGGSHWIQNDEPEKVNQFIREFLSGKKSE